LGTGMGVSLIADVASPGRLGKIGEALQDTWHSSSNTDRNKATIEQSLGRFAFDTALMTAGGLTGCLLGRKLPSWEEWRGNFRRVWESPENAYVRKLSFEEQYRRAQLTDPRDLFTPAEVRKYGDGSVRTLGPGGRYLTTQPDGSMVTRGGMFNT